MSAVAVAIGGSALIGGAAGLIGAGMQSNAAENAANTQAGAAHNAAQLQYNASLRAQDIQQGQYNQQRSDMQPYMQAGYGALSQMQDPRFTQQATQDQIMKYADPSYNFRFQQGQQALEASAAARGQTFSGNTLKALTDYGQNSAQEGYQNAFNNYYTAQNTVYNRLAGIAGMGMGSVNALGQAGQNYANNASNAVMGGANAQANGITGAANAQAAGGMGAANAWAGGISGLGNAVGGGANNWMQYSMMNKLINKGTSDEVMPGGATRGQVNSGMEYISG